MTFSIIARCPRTGRFAVAAASSSPAVAARCAHARAGVGAVASQNVTDPRLGPRALAMMADGASAEEAIGRLRASAPHIEYRQLAAVDRRGGTAHFSGVRTLGVHAALDGGGAVAAGNMLASPDVPRRMLEAFHAAGGDGLGERVMAAMRAGLAAGGEAGPIHSAGMLMVEAQAWPLADLRVDWHETPIEQLDALWSLWRPQMDAYVQRALRPDLAPSYGVPGDEAGRTG